MQEQEKQRDIEERFFVDPNQTKPVAYCTRRGTHFNLSALCDNDPLWSDVIWNETLEWTIVTVGGIDFGTAHDLALFMIDFALCEVPEDNVVVEETVEEFVKVTILEICDADKMTFEDLIAKLREIGINIDIS